MKKIKNKKLVTIVDQLTEVKKCDQLINVKTLVNPIEFEELPVHMGIILPDEYKFRSNKRPKNDVEINIIPRKQMVFNSGLPMHIQDIYDENLLAKLCIEFFTSHWIVTCYRDLSYNGPFWSLPNIRKEIFNVKEQKFLIDDDKDKDAENMFNFKDKGVYLESELAVCGIDGYQMYRTVKTADMSSSGTEVSSNKINPIPAMVQFSISELSDGTKVLRESMIREGHVQEIIYLDLVESMSEMDDYWINLSFKIKQKPVYLYTGSKENQEFWLKYLNDAINSQTAKGEISGIGDPVDRTEDTIQEMLLKIVQETEQSAATSRKEDHQNLLTISPDILGLIKKKCNFLTTDDIKSPEKSVLDDSLIRPQVEQIYPRLYFRLTAHKLLTSIQFSPENNSNKDAKILPEPFFISCCLVHVSDNRRISEEFQWNPNHPIIESLLPKELFCNKWLQKQQSDKDTSNTTSNKTPLDLPTFSNHTLQNCKSFIVKTPYQQPQIGVLIRIDKVFNGMLASWVDKYVKYGGMSTRRRDGVDEIIPLDSSDNKSGQSIHKAMLAFCSNIGHYRMPFCWSFCKLNNIGQVKLPLYRYDGNKYSDEDLFKQIHYLNLDPTNRVMTVPGFIDLTIEEISEGVINKLTDLVNTDLVCKVQSNSSQESGCCKEIKELLFDPLRTGSCSQFLTNQMKHASFNDSSSLSSNSRPTSNYGISGATDVTDEASSEDLTPSGDVYNSNFFSLPINSNILTDNIQGMKNHDEMSQKNSVNQEDLIAPFLDFVHSLYVYPRTLNLSNQNIFHRARNLSCFIELRNSDLIELSIPLKVIHSRPSNKQPAFDSWANTSVIYHDTCPTFNEEIKMSLPINITAKHHLLFRFYHVSCDTAGTISSKDKASTKKSIETPVGFAWLPLLDKHLNLNSGTFNLPIATNLAPNYLNDCNLLGQIQWVDGQKPLFSVVLKAESSIYTPNVHLHKFFRICSETLPAMVAKVSEGSNGIVQRSKSLNDSTVTSFETNTITINNAMKALASVDVANLILFIGPTFNQLFTIIVTTCTTHPKISQTAVTTIINLSSTLRGQSLEVLSSRAVRRNTTILKNYIKYSFDSDKIVSDHSTSTVHDCLVRTITELIIPPFRDTNFIFSFLQNSFLLYSVIVKSMIQSSTNQDKIKNDRNEPMTFATTFTSYLENLIHLVVSCILEVSSNQSNYQGPSRTHSVSAQSLASSANKDLARFIARLFNVMDRGFIFRGIYQYMKVVDSRIKSNSEDEDQLSKMKLEFLEIICQHEHFIALNLTEADNRINEESLSLEISLTEPFCQAHYLIGLVLLQVHQQMSNTFSSNVTRRLPFILLRNLMAKHSLDDRYKSDSEQYKIARLYLPLISIVLENQKALSMPGTCSNKATILNGNDIADKSASSRQFSLFSGDSISTHSSLDGSDGGGGSIYGVGTGAGALTNKSGRSSQAYLDKEGRVESHFLSMIAGLTTEGLLRDLSRRRQIESDTSSINSTSTLTGLDEFDEAENSSLSDEMVVHTKIDFIDSSSRRGSLHKSLTSASSSLGRRAGVPLTLNLKKNSASPYTNQRMSSGQGVSAGINKMSDTKSQLCLNDKTQKDVFLSLMHLFSNLSTDDMKSVISRLMVQERTELLQLLIYATHHLKYQGKNSIFDFESISRSDIKPGHGQALLRSKFNMLKPTKPADDNDQNLAVLDGNVSSEVGLVVLDVLSLYCSIYKQEILTHGRDHALFRRIIDVYFTLLTVNQSDTVLRHTLVSMRIFVGTFSKILFSSCNSIICDLSFHVLRYCDSRSPGVRSEACGFLYRMMRSSYESFNQEGLNGVHLQMIVAVSKLDRIVGRRFNQSLTYLRELAEFEMKKAQLKPMIKPKPLSRVASSVSGPVYKMDMRFFFEGVSDLTQRIRTVLMATVKMNVHKDDPEMLVDLQYSLAKSYSSNPALRRTWLEKIYTVHEKTNSKAEMAMCKAHIVAMMCEHLKRKELYSIGCGDFEVISPNIAVEESVISNDSAQMDVHYSTDEVIVLLREMAQAFDVAGLWEMLRHIYKLIMPIYEKKRDYEQLGHIYEHLASACKKIKNSESNNQRLIGSYYQVVFYGKPFENLDGKSFVYRLDSGKQFCVAREELQVLFQHKYGRENVTMLVENYLDRTTLDPNMASVHVTHVDPFFDDDEQLDRQSMFERQYNLSRFMLETPFMKESHDSIEDVLKSRQTDDLSMQWKRRTILTVEATFPHLKRRLEVISTKDIDFSPIERAVDEIKSKNRELVTDLMFSKQSGVHSKLPSSISNHSGNINLLMDMHLAGALLPQVNQGPMAYARVFLQKENQLLYAPHQVKQLKVEFMEFLSLCNLLLVEYNGLMSHIHAPKYWAMRSALDKYRIELSNLLNEEITVDYEKMVICSGALSEHVHEHLSKRLGMEVNTGD